MPSPRFGLVLTALAVLPACPRTSTDPDARHGVTDAPSLVDAPTQRVERTRTSPPGVAIRPFTECSVVTYEDTFASAAHQDPCTPLPLAFYPPAGGPHYSEWAAFNTYSAPVPWGFLMHSMEHGAVVLAYHCETEADCAPVRAELEAIARDRGADPLCRAGDSTHRIILVPDPELPVPIAAIAWRHTYTATCLDPASLRAFVDTHYGMAPENLCAPGVDRSSSGWCPSR